MTTKQVLSSVHQTFCPMLDRRSFSRSKPILKAFIQEYVQTAVKKEVVLGLIGHNDAVGTSASPRSLPKSHPPSHNAMGARQSENGRSRKVANVTTSAPATRDADKISSFSMYKLTHREGEFTCNTCGEPCGSRDVCAASLRQRGAWRCRNADCRALLVGRMEVRIIDPSGVVVAPTAPLHSSSSRPGFVATRSPVHLPLHSAGRLPEEHSRWGQAALPTRAKGRHEAAWPMAPSRVRDADDRSCGAPSALLSFEAAADGPSGVAITGTIGAGAKAALDGDAITRVGPMSQSACPTSCTSAPTFSPIDSDADQASSAVEAPVTRAQPTVLTSKRAAAKDGAWVALSRSTDGIDVKRRKTRGDGEIALYKCGYRGGTPEATIWAAVDRSLPTLREPSSPTSTRSRVDHGFGFSASSGFAFETSANRELGDVFSRYEGSPSQECEGQGDGGSWTCHKCTLINERRYATKCVTCGFKRKGGAPKRIRRTGERANY